LSPGEWSRDMTAERGERRRRARLAVPDGRDLLVALSAPLDVVEISDRGVLLTSAWGLDAGRRGELRVVLGDEPFVAEVEVRRCESGPDGYRVAAVFCQCDERHREHIQRFLGQARG
jgi:hypothetical protein